MFVFICIFLLIYLFLHLSFYLFVCLFIHSFIYLLIYFCFTYFIYCAYFLYRIHLIYHICLIHSFIYRKENRLAARRFFEPMRQFGSPNVHNQLVQTWQSFFSLKVPSCLSSFGTALAHFF